MNDAEFKSMVDNNIWHDDLSQLVEVVKFCTQPDFVWSWSRTPGWKCKYVDVRIDMRDGGFILSDKDGNRISPEQLKAWGLKDHDETLEKETK